jgi:oxalate decarboxylase/phosphoglucose isomerase-like protein (cupin superfamily)
LVRNPLNGFIFHRALNSCVKHVNVLRHLAEFRPLLQSRALQAAVMVLGAGQSSGQDVENEHPASEQWLYVISGAGAATVARQHISLVAGDLLWIPKAARHRITNTGRARLITLNFYCPPAYTHGGELIS